MLYRAFAAGVILFWLVMMGLLARSEWFGAGAAQTPVPLAHVIKQVFLHEEVSDLGLYRQRQRLGGFHVQPKRGPADGSARTLQIMGDCKLDAFGSSARRVLLRASIELDERQSVRHFAVAGSLREPHQTGPNFGFDFEGWPAAGRFRYAIKQGDVVQKEATGTPDELLGDPALASLGFDPRTILRQAATQATAGETRVDAHRSTLSYNGETVGTYIVAFKHGAALESTLQMTEQGQMLSLTTFAGLDLYDDALAP